MTFVPLVLPNKMPSLGSFVWMMGSNFLDLALVLSLTNRACRGVCSGIASLPYLLRLVTLDRRYPLFRSQMDLEVL